MLQTRPPSNPNRFSISNRDERPGTSGSNTSLRRAVLNIAAVETKRESVLAEKKMREGKAKDEAKMRPRGYSGAWP
ncbi:hypothetical protein EJ02DRAFT_456057 [Clathrospora elynae]|uniref:Uncharacterized protein n=1 Tax=Clathrospora elynae TaxID=706981 RepID=A0A6A5SIG4_9PLEO|nr:hypothetical protein EJ02DRAFT_456057 [Clathrospora elynae]